MKLTHAASTTGHATAAAPTRSRARGPLGFSLVEILVGIALFGVSMSAIAALTFAVTRQSAATAGTVERTAVLEARVNDLFSIPWTSLEGRVGCTTLYTAPLTRTECIQVTTIDASRKHVTLTIAPADVSIDPTTISVERTKPPAANPFNVRP